tara:strand:+ start:87 stop:1808 length:1722 start_codon:yes stop_codon:yes gene_type:complete
MKKNFLTILIIFFGIYSGAQESKSIYPQNYFGSPLDIPLFLAGNFAELRSNHFHAGIDIKTQSVEGKNVLSSADGFVSRIKIRTGGYGKIIYIDHPNGYTTTYAHLQKFSKKIDAFVKKEQYHQKSFSIDYYPDSNEIKVLKGELIALSGNTGGSGGPHLHFEIRETESEHAMNVLLFNMPIKDKIAPIIRGIRIYPLGDNSSVAKKPFPNYYSAKRIGNKYTLNSIPVVSNKIGFGIETIDKMNGTGNRCGVYNIKLLIDGQLVFEQQTERVPFDESRYINSHTDYRYKKSNRKWIHKSFVDPNNKLSIYKKLERDGTGTFTNDSLHNIKYIVSDVYGNTSELNFKIKSNPEVVFTKKPIGKDFIQTMPYHIYNEFQSKEFLLQIPKGGLYNDINFSYSSKPHPKKRWSPIHTVHSDNTPLHKPIDVFIKCEFPTAISPSNLIAVRKTSAGKVRIHKGTYSNNYFHFTSKYFGSFYIYHDTIPPRIKPLNIYNGKNISKQSKFDFKISDNLSGIKSYDCYIDGEWILLEYDYKKARLTHYKHGVIKPGEHKLKLVIIDAVGNKEEFNCKFIN